VQIACAGANALAQARLPEQIRKGRR